MKGNKIFDFSRKGFQDIINIMTNKINECVDVANGMIARLDDYVSKIDWDKIVNDELYQNVLDEVGKTNEQLDNIKRINVKQFGAIGDGLQNDTLAIQNCINSITDSAILDNPKSYEVYFPKCDYLVYYLLILRPNISFVGDG